MEKNRHTKMISLVAMIIAVVGLTIAYAAFTKSLNITFGTTTVNGNSANFSVKLSTAATGLDSGSLTPVVSDGVTGTKATLGSTSITNLGATFPATGGTATYTFYAVNDGAFTAYLNSITVANVASASYAITCSASAGTSAAMVATACANVSMTITADVDSTSALTTTATSAKTGAASSLTTINGHSIATTTANPRKSHKFIIQLKATSTAVDGDFTVKFGNVTLDYSTQD